MQRRSVRDKSAGEPAIDSMKSAFMPYKQRIVIIYDVLKLGFAKAGKQLED
jgi:hypothetical protein